MEKFVKLLVNHWLSIVLQELIEKIINYIIQKELIADIEDDHVKNAINSILDELNS